ncbi:hypothetical protein GCM10009624_31740 [Gordonia sinesedis]
MHSSARLRDTSASRRSPRFRILTVLAFVVASATAFAGVAQAAPTPTTQPVKYTVSNTKDTVKIAVGNGSIGVDDGFVVIKNKANAELWKMPLSYNMENRQFPIDAKQADNAVTLTPSKNLKRSTLIDGAKVEVARKAAAKGPQTKQERDDKALARFNEQLRAGMTISTIVGTAIGAVVGGIAGCVLGLPAGPFGCIFVGLPLGATVGGIAGTVFGGGGTLIVAGIQYLQTINSPFKPPKN